MGGDRDSEDGQEVDYEVALIETLQMYPKCAIVEDCEDAFEHLMIYDGCCATLKVSQDLTLEPTEHQYEVYDIMRKE